MLHGHKRLGDPQRDISQPIETKGDLEPSEEHQISGGVSVQRLHIVLQHLQRLNGKRLGKQTWMEGLMGGE